MKRYLFALVAIWLLAGLFSASPAFAQPELTLAAQAQRVSLEGYLAHFADPTGQLDFNAAKQRDYVRLPAFRSQGHDAAVHWYHFKIGRTNDAPSLWMLSVGLLNLDEVDVHVEQPDRTFQVYRLGDNRPFNGRPLQTRLALVPVDVFGDMQVYIRVRTNSTINVTAELWQPKTLVTEETRTNLFQGFYFGILLIIAVFYAVLGAWLRDVILAAYAGYVATLIPMHMGYNGYLPMLLATDIPWLCDAVWRWGFLSSILFLALMWDRLLEMQRNFPRVHRLYLAIAMLSATLIPFAVTPFYANLIGPLLNPVAILIAVLAPTLTAVLWRRSRSIELLVYFIAFAIPAIGGTVQALLAMGGLPINDLTTKAYQITSLIHVLVMSFGLALRLRKMNRDKAAAEQEASLATKRAEEQRRFVAMLSHEFRNPLVAIDSSTQMLQMKIPNLESLEAERLQRIRGNVATLSGLVDNFLITESLDHGANNLSRKHCEILTLLTGVIHAVGAGSLTNVHLTVTPPTAIFDLDDTLIGMAVGNLITNGLRYSPPGSPVEISATLDASGLCIKVLDQGPGLSTEDLKKLGTPYFRAGTSLGKKGSGLGYYFTRRIAEAHGGSLHASTREGGGLIVEIRLP